MDEKDRQLYETTLVVESAKQTAELGKEVISDVVRPTSKSIGENIGLVVDGVFGWLGLWGEKQKIKQQKNLDDFKNEINGNLNKIPEKNLKEPTMYIIGPAIEASKYYYEEDQFKKMFAKLIAASCDDRATDKISPYFVEAIKQLTPDDALILSLFKAKRRFGTVNYRIAINDKGESFTYKSFVFYHNSIKTDINSNAVSIVNLQRIGLITVDFTKILTDDSNYQSYYKEPIFLQMKKQIKEDTTNKYKNIHLQKGVVEITPLGENFIDLCL